MAPVLLNPSRFGGGGGGGGTTYSDVILADSPLAYWKLDETTGTTAADSSGNGRNATYVGSPTLGATSLLSDGSGHAMGITANAGTCTTIASAAWMNVSTLTVECLVNLTSATDTANGDGIVSRYTGAGYQWILWRDTAGKLAGQLGQGNGATTSVTSDVTMALGTTYHVAMTYTGSVLTIYVNGVASGSPVTGMSGIWPTYAPLDVGRYSVADATTPGGSIDEVAFYGTALSAARIAAHYAAA